MSSSRWLPQLRNSCLTSRAISTRAISGLAKVVFEENDVKVFEDIIHLIDEYGVEKVKKAFAVVEKKSKDNPRRTFKYVIGIFSP
ncbi:hypothetical protein ACFL1F_00935 [Chlamydiota bacterium]